MMANEEGQRKGRFQKALEVRLEAIIAERLRIQRRLGHLNQVETGLKLLIIEEEFPSQDTIQERLRLGLSLKKAIKLEWLEKLNGTTTNPGTRDSDVGAKEPPALLDMPEGGSFR